VVVPEVYAEGEDQARIGSYGFLACFPALNIPVKFLQVVAIRISLEKREALGL
jgi:hypothetical protein